jgi:hypothetical protein
VLSLVPRLFTVLAYVHIDGRIDQGHWRDLSRVLPDPMYIQKMSLTPLVGKLQRHFSFTSDSNSTLTRSSEFYTTDCSESTVRGPGALSGTALKALGKLVLRTADDIAIQLRITSIRSTKTYFHRSEWDDLLEFSR